MRTLFKSIALLGLFTQLSHATPAAKPLTVGIILPLQHQALTDIAAGYQDKLRAHYPGEITFLVENALGDLNIQRAIIDKMKTSNVDIVVPIATQTTQMTAKHITDRPIISLAANYTEQERMTRPALNLTGVADEFPADTALSLIKEAYPGAKNITLILSASDRMVKQAAELEEKAKSQGLTVTPLMIQALPDLYAIGQSLPQATDLVFILKDNLVASGITVLTQLCAKAGLPLLTSDEGTVKAAAPVGLGISEYAVGEKGADLTLAVLKGTPIRDLKVQSFTTPTLYVRDIKNPCVGAAKKLGLPVHVIKGGDDVSGRA